MVYDREHKESMEEMTLSSICVVNKFQTQKPIAYVAVSEGTSIEVWAGFIEIDGLIKEMRSLIKIEEA